MTNYSLMGNDISNATGDGPPNFPFGIKFSSSIKDIANGTSYQITNTDGFSYFTSSVPLTGSNKGFILPLAASNIGRTLTFKRIDAAGNENTGGNGFWFTITAQASDLIDGLYATTPLIAQNSSITLFADMANSWRVIRCQDFMQVRVTTPILVPASNQAGDAATILVPTGTWDMTSSVYFLTPSVNATIIATGILTGVGQSGNNYSSRVFGDTWVTAFVGGAVAADGAAVVANHREILAASATFYAKFFITYSSGSPSYCVRFSMRRFS